MHMPVTDGEALASALRALPAGRRLPMIMLRSLGPLPAPRSGVAFAAVLTKPTKENALKTAVLGALSSDPLSPEPVPSGALPTVPVPRDRSGTPQAAPTEPAGPEPRPRVLLAEDNAVNQKVAKLMLARLGYEVDAVDNGAEAVAALMATPYPLVLMDIHMPQMDGLEATRILRAQLPADRQPRIIALTASALVEDRRACTEAGMDGYLMKPFRQEQLGAVLRLIR